MAGITRRCTVNDAFKDGVPATYAQGILVKGICPAGP